MIKRGLQKSFVFALRNVSSQPKQLNKQVTILNQNYVKDEYTNVTSKILSLVGRNLYLQRFHPLNLIKQRIVNYFYKAFVNRRGNPEISVHENLPPVVSVYQNFDSLLIPPDHPSRLKSDCYYVNREYLLRAHMTAFQNDLLKSGLSNFLMIGDVYRRDEIDRTHYPVFHQIDAVRLKTKEQVFYKEEDLNIFEEGTNTVYIGSQEKQACHSLEAVKLMEFELKNCLEGLAKELFGDKIDFRWVETSFPFTQPSWELEIFYENNWLELLGCGIMKQPILNNAGINNKIGWAFGLGLERLAMILYKIPDIRLFWSKDTGFLHQFKTEDPNKTITYTPISQYPQLTNDISFWIPEDGEFTPNDFYDIARSVGGDLVEQVSLFDTFKHPKTGKTSHSYRIVYRHMEKTLTQREANIIHKTIAAGVAKLGAVIR